ncbi:hypothetical protein EDC04DRAFT_2868045 [Pisolithus marmoratus]|nr:hypothetical protein EDC04DRAFT_2868045 [Pisolithus marmoratus]
MKLLKRAGRASEQDGISTTKPAGDKDPGLHTRLAYFVANGPYSKHVLQFATQEDISTCSGFKFMAHVETKFATGLCVTGFVHPCGVGDLQKGEHYCNMDYIFFSAIFPLLFLSVIISYDIACQWKLNLACRIGQLPDHLHVPLAVVASLFMFSIPKFHAPAHAASCAIPHSLNLMPGARCTDSEVVKHNWSEINHVTNSTKEMGHGAWHDTIDDHFGHHNFRKLVGLGRLLCDWLRTAVMQHSRHCAALEEFNLAIDFSQRETWMTMLTAWEADKSQLNPYIATQPFPTEAKSVAACGELSSHKMPPSSFIALVLAIEETQCMRSLKSDVLNESWLMVTEDTTLHVEWAKAHACAVCWSEEVKLLQEEMQHTNQFLQYRAEWWEQHREFPNDVLVDSFIREGISAYADQQATLQHKLSNHFSTLWHQAGHIQPEGTNDDGNGPTYFPSIDDNTYEHASEVGDDSARDKE